MAYTVVNNSVFASDEVADGTDVAQLNDNIEDTRTRVSTLETTVSGLDFSLTKLMYRKEAVYPGAVNYSVSSANTPLTLSETQTAQTLTPSTITDFDILNGGKLDFSSFRFGDKITVRFEGNSSANTQLKISTTTSEYINTGWGTSDDAEIVCVIESETDLADATVSAQRTNGVTTTGSMSIDKITFSINVG